jgi:hypothetical protein
LKAREPRQKVLIQARIRVGNGWSDANILNYSSRGMLVHASPAPPRGSYLEIRRGSEVLVARVVWAEAERFGVRTQDPVPAGQLLGRREGDQAGSSPGGGPARERRRQPRAGQFAEQTSRWRGRRLEFAIVAALGAVTATFIMGGVNDLLAKPMAAVRTSLGN